MITAIGPNKTYNRKIWGIPVFFILFIGSILLIMYPGPHDDALIPRLCALSFSVTLAVLVIYIFLLLVYIPNEVIIDDGHKQLTLKYLMAKQKTIQLNDVSEYKKTVISSKAGPFYGVLIYINKKPVLLSDFNLNSYMPIKQLLDDLKINDLGEERFSFTRYFTRQWAE